MYTLFDEFGKLVIENADKTVVSMYNWFLTNSNDEEAAYIKKHFILFLKVGEAARESLAEVRNELSC